MHDEIDFTPPLAQHVEGGIDGGGIGDVAMTEQFTVELLRQRLDALFERIALPGQRNLRACRAARLGNSPGDRAVVGNAENHPALALHQSRILRHWSGPSRFGQRIFGYTSRQPRYSANRRAARSFTQTLTNGIV